MKRLQKTTQVKEKGKSINYKMWVQFIILCSPDHWSHHFSTSLSLLSSTNSLKIQSNKITWHTETHFVVIIYDDDAAASEC
jgi:hypothetical protein